MCPQHGAGVATPLPKRWRHRYLPGLCRAGPACFAPRGPRGIRALLEGMQMLLGWEPILEGEQHHRSADVTGGGAISLEPGGQFELSGAPLETDPPDLRRAEWRISRRCARSPTRSASASSASA
jgi:hypothetical protein